MLLERSAWWRQRTWLSGLTVNQQVNREIRVHSSITDRAIKGFCYSEIERRVYIGTQPVAVYCSGICRLTCVHKTCFKAQGRQVCWDTTQLFFTVFVTLFCFPVVLHKRVLAVTDWDFEAEIIRLMFFCAQTACSAVQRSRHVSVQFVTLTRMCQYSLLHQPACVSTVCYANQHALVQSVTLTSMRQYKLVH